MKKLALIPLLLAAAPTPPALAPSEIVAAAPASEWVTIAPSDLLVMELAPKKDGASTLRQSQGSGRRVVIQLMPPPFSQGWVGNIRKLATARWWDGTSINRVQDNYVVQWGDADAEDKAKAKSLPQGLAKVSQDEYDTRLLGGPIKLEMSHVHQAKDAYAASTTFMAGFPAAVVEPAGGPTMQLVVRAWPVHCYGMVGVGRGMPPDTGSGAELYTVIGHAPRHLDRNIALVGRVIEGIEHLSSLPRGTGALGFYEKAEERVPIVSVRLGNEVKDLPRFEYLSTESDSFARYADARADRRDAFFIQPAGGADICNIPVPVRRVQSR